ncbi:MAG: TMEM165/GDT1 family protein [Desulfonauticus sp.]|nr:TMEM165/GDT1 family protein [Desulfonauticus sp.]
MDLKLLITTFFTLFLAELGDKTQLACVMLTAKTQKPVTVFIGASLALCLVTLLGVVFASFISNYISPQIIKKIASLGFIVIGILMFMNKM